MALYYDLRHYFKELQNINQLKKDICGRCLCPTPSGLEPSATRCNAPAIVYDQFESYMNILQCEQCKRSYHKVCCTSSQLCLCKSKKNRQCTICGNRLGLVETFCGEPVHFICAYFSKRYILKDALTFEFLRVGSSAPKLKLGHNCWLCSNAIPTDCSYFSCEKCEYKTHMFCALYFASHFDLCKALRVYEIDQLTLPIPLLDQPVITNFTARTPTATELASLDPPPNLPPTYEDTFFNFKLLCPDHKSDAKFCCSCRATGDSQYAQCEFCQSWCHLLTCGTQPFLDPSLLDEARVPEYLRAGAQSKRDYFKNALRPQKESNGAERANDCLFYLCPMC